MPVFVTNAAYNNVIRDRKPVSDNIKKKLARNLLKASIGENGLKEHDEYNKNPKLCINCGNKIEFRFRNTHTNCSNDCRKEYNRKHMDEYSIYKADCKFKFALNDYPEELDFSLIEKHGWYKAKNNGDNIGGISRDHMYSIRDGFENGISAELIAHPANCELMIHSNNISKNKKSSITLNELEKRIIKFKEKYK